MSKHLQTPETGQDLGGALQKPIQRRSFLLYTGATVAATGLLLAGCDDDDDNGTTTTVNLGSGDVGVLNYAYALEQLEAAFYAQVVATPYSGITADERTGLTAIAKHEAIHRDFFKAAITSVAASQIIPGLTPDFSKVNFADRNSVLTTAKTFEDLGVAAYNGAGALIKDNTYLLLAGKIVSVEARHAGYIRDLLSNGDFAGSDVVNASGLDRALSVADVLAAAQPFIKEKISGDNVGK
ncbi:ferritin-like domain-containing protein [Hymenobacter busanensis]|uniref:Ferritin-like domain-containing protein n=1 Tax=Hymenobacter busanensis TaxID=2607656 RepID=A0A7L5A4I1_9BACT|nr:ferritin-like domain-containing protein [Hymenobacter busanensis]KAA9338542.1 ferritin-like domain-containing protein [Hymenobacter busanensis]QHJ09030.1 ferritin-like domain-containing protein [Hymenobacter busanensis]